MAESLKTIPQAKVEEFAGEAQSFKGSTLSILTQCVVYKNGDCPDQRLSDPRCGKCDIARADQTIMISDIETRGFQPKSGPNEMWHSDKIMTSELSKGKGTLSITHHAGSVELEHRP